MDDKNDPENPYRLDTPLGRVAQMTLTLQRWERYQRKPEYGGPQLEPARRQLEGRAEPDTSPGSQTESAVLAKRSRGRQPFDDSKWLTKMRHVIAACLATSPESAARVLLTGPEKGRIERRDGADDDSVIKRLADAYREAERLNQAHTERAND